MRTRGNGDRRDSDDSTVSSSSSSSAFSRGSGRSGYSTPATEVEEDYEQEDKFEGGEEEEKAIPRGFGYSLWSRIQTAATNLSVNVGKSLETSVSSSSGEGKQDSAQIHEHTTLIVIYYVRSDTSRTRISHHTSAEGLSHRQSQ